jgi:hypothetical protein
MAGMDKHIETYTKLLPLLKNTFEEYKDTLTTIMKDRDKHKMQLVHRGEKAILMDSR